MFRLGESSRETGEECFILWETDEKASGRLETSECGPSKSKVIFAAVQSTQSVLGSGRSPRREPRELRGKLIVLSVREQRGEGVLLAGLSKLSIAA